MSVDKVNERLGGDKSAVGLDVSKKPNTQDSDPIDLETARSILEAVRDISERTFTNSSDLSKKENINMTK